MILFSIFVGGKDGDSFVTEVSCAVDVEANQIETESLDSYCLYCGNRHGRWGANKHVLKPGGFLVGWWIHTPATVCGLTEGTTK